MAARTDRLALLTLALGTCLAAPGAAQDDPVVDELRFRFTFFDQDGEGYQSPDGPADGPGSERAVIYQPVALVGVRQNERVRHSFTFPVDIVTAASPDAIDAMSRASMTNEAGGFDMSTTVQVGDDDEVGFRLGYHMEEPWRSPFGGLGYTRSLAQDNATIGANVNFIIDVFDPISHLGVDSGLTTRYTLNANLAGTQILSPTTIAGVTYGLTYQFGTLETTYNSVPIQGSSQRIGELFPDTRLRHAVSASIAQHLPATRTTLRGRYRYYRDDFDLDAHTAEVAVYQYLGARLLVRLDYRYHTQSAVRFFTTSAPADLDPAAPVTSDSDLASLDAHEVGGKLLFYLRPPGTGDAVDSLDLSFHHYERSNGLRVDAIGFGYARSL